MGSVQHLSERMLRAQPSAVRELLKHSKIPGMLSLAGGIPATDLFDVQGLRCAVEHALDSNDVSIFQYGLTEGDPGLRSAVADLMQQRGASVHAEDVIITSGSQQFLEMTCKTFINEGDAVLVERPTYLAALQVFDLAGARVVSVESDHDGIRTDEVERLIAQTPFKFIYVVPNFGNPTGTTLPLDRRVQLVDSARRHQTLILEDDPYGELRLSGSPLPSLFQLGKERHGSASPVLYMSSFSKILAPGLRVGWGIGPTEFTGHLTIAKQAIDLHASSLSQRIVLNYLSDGRLKKRLDHLREQYRLRRDALYQALLDKLGQHIELNKPDGGMFLWGRLKNGLKATELLAEAIEQKVVFVPGSAFYSDNPDLFAVRFSFATITPDRAHEAADRLSRAIDQALARSRMNSVG